LRGAAQAVPFISERRLVVVSGVSKAFSASESRVPFLELLEDVPQSTALVLLEPDLEDKKKKKKDWLLKWAESGGPRSTVRRFDLLKGPQMAAWLQTRANELGGELRPQAAMALAQLVSSDKDAAEQEIEKLLAFVAYQRPIEAADVAAVSLTSGELGDFFALIDALSAGSGSRAMELLQGLLPERDSIMLFFSLVSHFRLLLQSREMVDGGQGDKDIARQFGIHPYRAEKLAAQARRFSLGALEGIYRRLLVLDEKIKTGEMEADLAMETFVASLSAQAA
jgi:DNA polymerase-3 subunit delta